MLKNLVRPIMISLLIFSSKSESAQQTVDFDSCLSSQDHVLLGQDELMVYMPTDFVGVMKNFSADTQELKDLVDHVRMGYSIVSLKDITVALEHAMKHSGLKIDDYEIIKKYQKAVLDGDALVRNEELGSRSRKNGNFCSLFVQNCASIGSLNVRCNLNVCGTVSASNFIFTGGTGCSAISTFPNISACGNVTFNTGGVNMLNAEGALEQSLRLLRATVSFGIPGISLVPTSLTPGSALSVGVVTPNAASLITGQGIFLGSVSGTAFSSGMVGSTPGVNLEYYFVVNLQLPITFITPYIVLPTVNSGMESLNPAVGSVTALVDDNTATVVTVSSSNLTNTGAILNMVFNIIAQGPTYTAAANNAALAVNNILANPSAFNALNIALTVNGPVN